MIVDPTTHTRTHSWVHSRQQRIQGNLKRSHNVDDKSDISISEEENDYWQILLQDQASISYPTDEQQANYHQQDQEIDIVRKSITDYMNKVSENMNLSLFTTQMAIVHLDQLISKYDISKIEKQMQLWAISLLLVASKFNELEAEVPFIEELKKQLTKIKYSYKSIVR